jgi:hypothetical protein
MVMEGIYMICKLKGFLIAVLFTHQVVVYATEQHNPVGSCVVTENICALEKATEVETHQPPKLIPFNQDLFNSYCTVIIERSSNNEYSLIRSFVFSSVLLSVFYINPLGLKVYEVCAGSHGSATNFLGAMVPKINFGSLVPKISVGLLWSGVKTLTRGIIGLGITTYMAAMALNLVLTCATSAKALYNASLSEEQEIWEAYKELSCEEQEKLWHAIIYEKFGNPTVEGSTETEGCCELVFLKKYGAGRVHFDPRNIEQVEVLLGIHATKSEDLRCDHICIST